MYISPNFGGSHLMLLGGSAVQQANNQMNLGAETLDLFKRPISSAQAIMDGVIEAFPENAEGPAARGGVNAGKESGQSQRYDYDAWFNETVAFWKAANSSLGTAANASGSGTGQNVVGSVTNVVGGDSGSNTGNSTSGTGDTGSTGTGGTSATADSGGSAATGSGSTGGTTDTGTSSTSGDTGSTSTNTSSNTGQTSGSSSGGGLAGLLGGLFGR